MGIFSIFTHSHPTRNESHRIVENVEAACTAQEGLLSVDTSDRMHLRGLRIFDDVLRRAHVHNQRDIGHLLAGSLSHLYILHDLW